MISAEAMPERWKQAIDPARWARDVLHFDLDPWQVDVLRSSAKRKVFNCARQSGKSTVSAIKALHRVIFYDRALVLLISPSLRQSSELFRKVLDLVRELPEHGDLVEENKLSLAFANGSRIVSLPSSETTIRGYSSVSLIIEDEAAAVPDELHAAVLPMLAVSNGELDLLSTPRGKVGHFYEAWASDAWEKVRFTAQDNPRISAEFLEQARKDLGSRIYSQEFMCEFLEDQEGALFRREWFEIVDDYPRKARSVRRWDMAATADGGDYTAGVRMVEHQGQFYIVDVQHAQLTSKGNEDLVAATAQEDGIVTAIRMEQEPGSSGVNTIDHYARVVLKGYDFKGIKSTGSKVQRAMPLAAAAEAKNVKLVRGKWNKEFLDELCSFPLGQHDDMVDGASGAHEDLCTKVVRDPNRFLNSISR
ncbi:MAG: Terminase-like family protein [Methanomassiliicoccales archaeon PtaB.Bin215]|nr:MAG: Terminase-like family protein [Methanomassiliicoccales archaeon PtaB.Bin215]